MIQLEWLVLHPKVQKTCIMTQKRGLVGSTVRGRTRWGGGGGVGPHPPSPTKILHQFLSGQEGFVESTLQTAYKRHYLEMPFLEGDQSHMILP